MQQETLNEYFRNISLHKTVIS